MDNIQQELEFLDLSDLPDDEVRNLRSVIGELKQQDVNVALPMEVCITGLAGVSDGGCEMSVPVISPSNIEIGVSPVGYAISDSVHPHLYQTNVCIPSIPQYQPIINYPIPMLSGPHMMGSAPNYYVGNVHSPVVSHHTSFGLPPRLSNPSLAGYPKRKNVRTKYPARKDVVNGQSGDGYSSLIYQPSTSYMGSCFPGDVVQAVTGVPIVMHQSVPSYAPPQNIQAPPAITTQVYPMTFVATTADIPKEVLSLKTEHDVTEVSVGGMRTDISTAQSDLSEHTDLVPAVELSLPPRVSTDEKPTVTDILETKSWASLFKKPAPATVTSEKPTARVEPFILAEVAPSEMSQVVSRTVEVRIHRMAEHLNACEMVMTPIALLPRGLINKSNWCYINATLQALLGCSPFVHLIKSLSPFSGRKSGDSCTPILDGIIEFIEQFEIVPVRTSKERTSLKKEELYFGSSFEPSSVYKMLSKIRSETFKVEGRQEDAEEFLSCLLNGLHDELLEAIKSIRAIENSPSPVAEVRHGSSDDGDWQVIGPKNRGCVTHTTSYSKTPISNLFLGLMRSALYYAGAQSTATLQPFFSLQLDIQSEKVNSVRDALLCLVTKEPLTGYVCSKTGQEVEASRQTTLEELPPILILHLKCFVYDKSGGCQKLLKRVEFSSDLELSKDFLSPTQKNKLKERQRQYKLFAVVYHDGKEATKGHYVTEVHHSGTGNWIRFDDSIVRVVDTQLFKYNLPRMPYLLLYRKLNL